MDKISEMLTKIRNAQMAGHKEVVVGFSNLKFALIKILLKEGFLESAVKIQDGKNADAIKIKLKYFQVSNTKRTPAINGLNRVSKCGQRIYVRSKDIKNVKNKYGIAILSTSKGIMTGEESRKMGLGGEYICEVW
jgi:small subunit ribosomal protein S8